MTTAHGYCQVIMRLTRKILLRHNHHSDKEKEEGVYPFLKC